MLFRNKKSKNFILKLSSFSSFRKKGTLYASKSFYKFQDWMKSHFLGAYGLCFNSCYLILAEQIPSVPMWEPWTNCPLFSNCISEMCSDLGSLQTSTIQVFRLKVDEHETEKDWRTHWCCMIPLTFRNGILRIPKCSLKSNENCCPFVNNHLHSFHLKPLVELSPILHFTIPLSIFNE